MRLFLKFVFTEAPPQFLPETKSFAIVKDSSRFSAPCDLPETIKNIFEKFRKLFSSIFCFLKVFRIERCVFCCFQLGKNGFRDLCVSLRVFFGAVKLMKLKVLLPLVLRMILLIWFSSKVRKCLRSTASPLCDT